MSATPLPRPVDAARLARIQTAASVQRHTDPADVLDLCAELRAVRAELAAAHAELELGELAGRRRDRR